ncbi:unnamed protein product, partial [Cyprideis torosa]
AVARRIVLYAKEGDQAKAGSEYGFIKFGSRLDVFLPLESEILTKLGDTPKGGIDIIAKLPDNNCDIKPHGNKGVLPVQEGHESHATETTHGTDEAHAEEEGHNTIKSQEKEHAEDVANEGTHTEEAPSDEALNEEDVMQDEAQKTQETDGVELDSIGLRFTAFKTPDKVGVDGTFNKVDLNARPGNDIVTILNGASFSIDTKGVNTGDAGRDEKLNRYFFGQLNSDMIHGTFNSVSDEGIELTLNLNEKEKTYTIPAVINDDSIQFNFTINVVEDFAASNALAAINNACSALHQGKDPMMFVSLSTNTKAYIDLYYDLIEEMIVSWEKSRRQYRKEDEERRKERQEERLDAEVEEDMNAFEEETGDAIDENEALEGTEEAGEDIVDGAVEITPLEHNDQLDENYLGDSDDKENEEPKETEEEIEAKADALAREEASLFTDFLRIIFDEDDIAELFPGNAVFVLHGLFKKTLEYTTYDWNDEYEMEEIKKTREVYSPEFTVVAETENETFFDRFLKVMMKEDNDYATITKIDGNFYKANFGEQDLISALYFGIKNGVVVVSTSEHALDVIKKGKKASIDKKTKKYLKDNNVLLSVDFQNIALAFEGEIEHATQRDQDLYHSIVKSLGTLRYLNRMENDEVTTEIKYEIRDPKTMHG